MSQIIDNIAESITGMTLTVNRFGVKRAIKDNEQEEVGRLFDAEVKLTKTQKSLIDPAVPEYKAITKLLSEAYGYYRSHTIEYPMGNCRIIRRANIEHVDAQMKWYVSELAEKVQALWEVFGVVKKQMQEKLGTLYVEDEYPADIRKCFSLHWSYPDINPAEKLAELNPAIYEREISKMRANVANAAVAAEKLFGDEMRKHVQKMLAALTPEEGKRKSIKEGCFDKAIEFCDRFRMMNINTDSEFTALMSRLEDAVKGADVGVLNSDKDAKQELADGLGVIVEEFENHVVTRIGRLMEL